MAAPQRRLKWNGTKKLTSLASTGLVYRRRVRGFSGGLPEPGGRGGADLPERSVSLWRKKGRVERQPALRRPSRAPVPAEMLLPPRLHPSALSPSHRPRPPPLRTPAGRALAFGTGCFCFYLWWLFIFYKVPEANRRTDRRTASAPRLKLARPFRR